MARPRANSLEEIMNDHLAHRVLERVHSDEECSSEDEDDDDDSAHAGRQPCAKRKRKSRLSHTKAAKAAQVARKGRSNTKGLGKKRARGHDARRADDRDARQAQTINSTRKLDCVCCEPHLEMLAVLCQEQAARTTFERSKKLVPKTPFNFPRLAAVLNANLFDLHGNTIVHHGCLAVKLGVSKFFIGNLRARHIRLLGSPIVTMSKDEAKRRNLIDGIVVPQNQNHLTHTQYLKSLAGADSVELLAAQVPAHGLAGKISNNALQRQQEAFVAFVRLSRSPTGRTQDAQGRFHGAQ